MKKLRYERDGHLTGQGNFPIQIVLKNYYSGKIFFFQVASR